MERVVNRSFRPNNSNGALFSVSATSDAKQRNSLGWTRNLRLWRDNDGSIEDGEWRRGNTVPLFRNTDHRILISPETCRILRMCQKYVGCLLTLLCFNHFLLDFASLKEFLKFQENMKESLIVILYEKLLSKGNPLNFSISLVQIR